MKDGAAGNAKTLKLQPSVPAACRLARSIMAGPHKGRVLAPVRLRVREARDPSGTFLLSRALLTTKGQLGARRATAGFTSSALMLAFQVLWLRLNIKSVPG